MCISKKGLAEGNSSTQMSGYSVGNFWPLCHMLLGELVGMSASSHPHVMYVAAHSLHGAAFMWTRQSLTFVSLSLFCFPAHSCNLPSKNLRIIESLVAWAKPCPEIGLDVLA